jgi:hypothetical protein
MWHVVNSSVRPAEESAEPGCLQGVPEGECRRLARRGNAAERGSRTYSRSRVPTSPQELSLAAEPEAQLLEYW